MITGRYPTSFGTHHMRSKLKVAAAADVHEPAAARRGTTSRGRGRRTSTSTCRRTRSRRRRTGCSRAARGSCRSRSSRTSTSTARTSRRSARRPRSTRSSRERLKPEQRVDPAKVELPPYYPDAPEVRRDLANYYELITAMDYRVGEILKALDEAGLADNTVVVFWGDHGRGLPRHKRWVYDSGIALPADHALAGEDCSRDGAGRPRGGGRLRPDVPDDRRRPAARRAAGAAVPHRRGQAESRRRGSTCTPPATGWTRRRTGSAACGTSGTVTSGTSIPSCRTRSGSSTGSRCRRCGCGASWNTAGETAGPAEAVLRADEARRRSCTTRRPTRTR